MERLSHLITVPGGDADAPEFIIQCGSQSSAGGIMINHGMLAGADMFNREVGVIREIARVEQGDGMERLVIDRFVEASIAYGPAVISDPFLMTVVYSNFGSAAAADALELWVSAARHGSSEAPEFTDVIHALGRGRDLPARGLVIDVLVKQA